MENTEYHKIETLFKRDMEGDKTLIEGEFRNELVEYLKDNEWIFTEKVDGTNIRVHWNGHTVMFGGRTNNAQIPTFLLNDVLYPKFAGTINEQLFEQKFGETPVTLYGEGYGEKIQKGGGKYLEGNNFILFDVKVGNSFLDREGVEDIAKGFGIKTVPVVLRGTIQEAVDFIKTPPNSVIAKEEKTMEGVVGVPAIRTYDHRGRRVIIKVKVEDFIKPNK